MDGLRLAIPTQDTLHEYLHPQSNQTMLQEKWYW